MLAQTEVIVTGEITKLPIFTGEKTACAVFYYSAYPKSIRRPAFFQGEYVQSKFEQPFRAADQDVTTWYLQGCWMLNGGHKPYKGATGVFGSPKVADKGLWELTGRYDYAENETLNPSDRRSLVIVTIFRCASSRSSTTIASVLFP